MGDKDIILRNIEKAVMEHNSKAMNKSMEAALKQGISEDNVCQALFQGLEYLRRRLMSSKVSIPHFLLSLDTMHECLQRIPSRQISESSPGDSLVIGVVEGDPHDLGKNIIAKVYETGGYRVYDIGEDVSAETFVLSVKEKQPKVLALSAMMSTTMALMPEIIRQVKAQFPTTVVMVGGAPLDTSLARGFGADGYAESAVNVLEETEAAIERVSAGEPW